MFELTPVTETAALQSVKGGVYNHLVGTLHRYAETRLGGSRSRDEEQRKSKVSWGLSAKRSSAPDGLYKLMIAKEPTSGAGLAADLSSRKKCSWSKRSR